MSRFGDVPRIRLNARWDNIKKYKRAYAMRVTFPSANGMNKPKAHFLVGT